MTVSRVSGTDVLGKFQPQYRKDSPATIGQVETKGVESLTFDVTNLKFSINRLRLDDRRLRYARETRNTNTRASPCTIDVMLERAQFTRYIDEEALASRVAFQDT